MKTVFSVTAVLLALALQISTVGVGYAVTTHDVKLGANDALGIDDLSFSPPSLVITQGDTVRWVTNSSVPHTVTSATGLFDSTPQFNDTLLQQIGPILFGPGGFLLPGASFNTTLSTAGDYSYHCKIHPFMQGTITVTTQPATPGEVVYATAGWGTESKSFTSYSPNHLTVRNGATVVWTNEEIYEPHTVTSDTGAFDSSPNITPQALAAFEALPFVIKGGQESFSYTFTQPGTFAYFCKLHDGMRAYVAVLAPTDLSKINSDISTIGTRLDMGTVLSAVAIVLGLVGTSISALLWRRPPKKSAV